MTWIAARCLCGILALLMVCAGGGYGADLAWMNVTTVGGGVPAAGGAASGVYRPDGDVTYAWDYDDDTEGTGPYYTNIDDAVTQPTAGSGNRIVKYEGPATSEWTVAEITGTISSIKVWIYGKVAGPQDGPIDIYISRDGTNWTSAQTATLTLNDTYEWISATFTGLSWTNTTDLRVRVNPTNDCTFIIDVVYLEANPS